MMALILKKLDRGRGNKKTEEIIFLTKEMYINRCKEEVTQ